VPVETEVCLSMIQLIFRKVADVKKEHELSERQKNEAPLDLPSDHPLRKLISRFRRRSERNLLSPFANHGGDPEVGLADDASRHTSPTTEQAVATSNDDSIAHLGDVTDTCMTSSHLACVTSSYLTCMASLRTCVTSYPTCMT